MTSFQKSLYEYAQKKIPSNPHIYVGTTIEKPRGKYDFGIVHLHFDTYHDHYVKEEAEEVGKMIEPLVSAYCQKKMEFWRIDELDDGCPMVITYWFKQVR